jgi:NAD kinase
MNAPRVVVVTRPTEYEELLVRHGTREQARFFLALRQQSLDEIEARHQKFEQVLTLVSRAIPVRWRRARIGRQDVAQFVWEPQDLVVAIGQDGLVPNVAKYLTSQLVIGINPDPAHYDGVLVRHSVDACEVLLERCHTSRCEVEERTMAEVVLDDGQRLLALNEVFVGHRSHQSARYRIRSGEYEERHSSSGLIVATGTGASGWARSIVRERAERVALPAPTEERLTFLVREAFPSVATGNLAHSGRHKTTAAPRRYERNERRWRRIRRRHRKRQAAAGLGDARGDWRGARTAKASDRLTIQGSSKCRARTRKRTHDVRFPSQPDHGGRLRPAARSLWREVRA